MSAERPKILFLLPEIHELATGGNTYNRRIIENIPGAFSVKQVLLRQNTDFAEIREYSADFVFFDTLLLDMPLLREYKNNHPGAKFILLVHYLSIFEYPEKSIDLLLADEFLCTSNFSKKKLVEAGINTQKIHVVYPGIEKMFFNEKEISAPAAPFQLLTVSSLFLGKGLLELIDVLSKLKHFNWRWTLIGEDRLDREFADKVFAKIESAGIKDRFIYPNPVERSALPAYYRRADLLLHPSQFETLSMVVREAVAAGLPVAAFNVGGLAENLPQNYGGLAAAGDWRKYSDLIGQFVINPVLLTAAQKKLLQKRNEFTDWKFAAKDLMEKCGLNGK